MSDIVSNLSALVPMLFTELPGCDDGYILNALKRVGRQFCVETEAWVKELAAINVVADTVTYTLATREEASVHRIKKVVLDDVDLDLRLVTLSTTGNQLVLDEAITPSAASTGGLEVTVVLRPFFGTTGYPEWFLDRYAEGIMAGAFAQLMLEPKKPWTNPEKGMFYKASYAEAKALARREVDVGHRSVDLRMDFQPFI